MNAKNSFINRFKARRVAGRLIKENTRAESFKDTDHGRKVYDTFKEHDDDSDTNTRIFVGCGISYANQQLMLIEGLQHGEDEMSIFVDGRLYFHGTQLGFDNKDVRKVSHQLLRQLTVSLGHYATAPAKFL